MTTRTPAPPVAERDGQKARRARRLEAEAAARRKAASRRLAVRVLAAVVGVALIAGVGYLVVQGGDVSLGVAPAEVAADSTVLPIAPQGDVADPAVGQPAPIVTGRTFDGRPVSIGGAGHPQAIVFMAHWCTFCQQEMPEIDDWVADGLLPTELGLVGVSTRHDPARPNWPPQDWFEREGFPGTSLVDSTEVTADAYGLTGTPMWVFVDAEGTVVARHAGVLGAEGFAEYAALAAGDAG